MYNPIEDDCITLIYRDELFSGLYFVGKYQKKCYQLLKAMMYVKVS